MNKKENICEISLIGFALSQSEPEVQLSANEKLDPHQIAIEEVFENNKLNYEYTVTTYTVNSTDFENRVINTIEYYKNQIQKKDYVIDTNLFYNNVKYMNKIDEYLILASSYIKYISNIMVTSDIGHASIVELSRCDDKMPDILSGLGYKETNNIKKKGQVWRYKNQPIVGIYSKVTSNDSPEGMNIFEVNGYCKETEKINMSKTISDIKNKLSHLFAFSS